MNPFAGTRRLVRLALRRDRVVLPVWIVTLTALASGVVASVTALYTTEQERLAGAAFTASSRIARVFDGPASGTEPGAMAMVEAFVIIAVLVALMSVQTVVRHTRQEEETGRAELLGSAVVGRHAVLAAGLTVAFGANLALAALIAVSLTVGGLAVGGAVAAGAAFAAVGASFSGVAAVTAQVASHQRAASGWAAAVLGAAFLLRAVGDATGSVAPNGVELRSAWPSWLSPLGWGQQVRPFHEDNWWVLLLFAGFVSMAVAIAFALTNRRDVGSGLVAPRLGPARAGPRLSGPLGLAWRQQRAVVSGWAFGLVALGAAFGAIGEGADELLTTNEQLEALVASFGAGVSVGDAYLAFMLALLGVAAAGYVVQALLRARAEEATGRLEPVLAAAVSRHRWLLSHVGVVIAAVTAILAATGLAAGLAYGLTTSDTGMIGDTMVAGLTQVPAALVIGGVTVATYAFAPRCAVGVGWSVLAASLVVGQFGDLLDLPPAVQNLSPFTHLPAVPAADLAAVPLVALGAVAVLSLSIGFAAFRRRDLTTT